MVADLIQNNRQDDGGLQSFVRNMLDTIERDEYLLRGTYNERRRISTWLRIGWLGIYVTIRHFARRLAPALAA